MTDPQEGPWEGQCDDAAYAFALRCAVLVARNPHKLAAPLMSIVNGLMTELWDRNFSQSEIRAAFEAAIADMPRYAAGEERRSATSAALATADLARGRKAVKSGSRIHAGRRSWVTGADPSGRKSRKAG